MEFNFCNISLHQVLNEIGSAQRMNMKEGVELLLDLPGQEIDVYQRQPDGEIKAIPARRLLRKAKMRKKK